MGKRRGLERGRTRMIRWNALNETLDVKGEEEVAVDDDDDEEVR
jgi:hypothetical protein